MGDLEWLTCHSLQSWALILLALTIIFNPLFLCDLLVWLGIGVERGGLNEGFGSNGLVILEVLTVLEQVFDFIALVLDTEELIRQDKRIPVVRQTDDVFVGVLLELHEVLMLEFEQIESEGGFLGISIVSLGPEVVDVDEVVGVVLGGDKLNSKRIF